MEVPYGDPFFCCPKTDVVRTAVSDAFSKSAPCKPHRVAPRVMISSLALFAHGHASEFATPDHEGVVKQSSLFEIKQ